MQRKVLCFCNEALCDSGSSNKNLVIKLSSNFLQSILRRSLNVIYNWISLKLEPSNTAILHNFKLKSTNFLLINEKLSQKYLNQMIFLFKYIQACLDEVLELKKRVKSTFHRTRRKNIFALFKKVKFFLQLLCFVRK